MTGATLEQLKQWIKEMASTIDDDVEPDPFHYAHFIEEPTLAFRIIELINTMDEEELDKERSDYSACIFALDICVAQLQSTAENGRKQSERFLNQLMQDLAAIISTGKHSLSFWLPILNAFYEAHVELIPELQNAYLDLASDEEDHLPDDEISHLDSIRDLIHELSDLSVFDIAENFFAQSYAMPPDFFVDLVMDLYSIEEGHEVALLMLLHPKEEVRDVVVSTINHLMPNLKLSSISLSRLQAIKQWYPKHFHALFEQWIKQQRKKGVVFHRENQTASVRIKASEVDGGGAQGLFIHLKKNRKNQLSGLLFKLEMGVKDAWITPIISAKDIKLYYDEAFDDSVMLRNVDVNYLVQITNHFMDLMLKKNSMPDLHLLEIQESLGLQFIPQSINVEETLLQLGVQIAPFTQETLDASLKRSKTWPKNKRFTESWFIENANIDKLVNRCCSYANGIKVCDFEKAISDVFQKEMELHRERWLFHFLWITLWLKTNARKNEKIWQDSFFIAYSIQAGKPLREIPIMHEICKQSVINSIETMQDRRTHLN